ncbi:hypothetical protein FOA52_013953 [Chlamydomonas sp. UWO 241]|nr:hypothetical protein FOA52_013953 [Chlamydomonas sp. UWO 241]
MCGRSHDDLAALAREVPPGCGGVSYLPYLSGERTPNWPHASGALLGLRPGSMSPGLLYRAALEGVTLSLAAGAASMRTLGMHPPNELCIVGGGARSGLWRQIVADVFQLPVRVVAEAETAALGAALQGGASWAGVSVGDFASEHAGSGTGADRGAGDGARTTRPNAGAAGAYGDALARHSALGEALFGGTHARMQPFP